MALIEAADHELPCVLDAAAALRDRGKGRTVTYSRKVFLPLTNLCRDDCGYCTFKRDPGQPGARTMELDEVLAVCEAGARLGCKEALLSLGDKPEARFPEHRDWLRHRGYRTTMDYVVAASRAIATETGLLPHANPGAHDRARSPGAPRLERQRGAHAGDRRRTGWADPAGPTSTRRTSARRGASGRSRPRGGLGIAFTTGILFGIGETRAERVESLLAIRELHERYGHVQEVIVQNFRAKPRDPDGAAARALAGRAPPDAGGGAPPARARTMNVQAPPNLSPGTYPALIASGLNDWGGVSPLTIDYINPEAPWPHLAALEAATAAAGARLRERLAIYPEFIHRPGFVPEPLRHRVLASVDAAGLVPDRAAHVTT